MRKATRKNPAPRPSARSGRPEIELEAGLPFTLFPADGVTKEAVRHWREEMTHWLADQHQRLAELLARFSAFDMLSSLLLVEVARNPETYKESEHQGHAAVVEYVALTYLLIVYDTTLLLLEAKAGGYPDAARRGGKSSIKTVVKNLLGDAHAQALRAKKYLASADTCDFRLPDKTTLTLAAGDFKRIIPVVVSLESLDIFNATLHEVANAGMLPAGELPWAVSLDILRVISELNEFPSQFIHYLTRRLRLNDYRKFHAHDELDWYGLYLESGLYYEGDKDVETASRVDVTSHTDRFDAYYAHQLGIRKTKATKPRQTMPHQFRQILADLETLPTRGYSEAILALLEWDDEGRQLVAERFRGARETTRQDGRLHNASFGSLNGNGITIAAAYGVDFSLYTDQLLEVVRLRKYQQQATTWLTLLTAVDESRLIRQFYLDTAPWQHDPQAEQLAEKLKPVQSVEAFQKRKK